MSCPLIHKTKCQKSPFMPKMTANLAFSVNLMCHLCRLCFDISPAVTMSYATD